MRILPMPCLPLSSAATRTNVFPCGLLPSNLRRFLPISISSTSTSPESRSRSGRIMPRRIFCRSCQPVFCRLIPSARERPKALIPCFWETTYQIAKNQSLRGMWLWAKIVPCVTDVSERQPLHRKYPRRIGQANVWAHDGQRNGLPQRTLLKYRRQSFSFANRLNNC